MQLMRTPRGNSTAAAFTKPSIIWFMVVPIVPSCIYSSVMTPEMSVNEPRSAMCGSAARTRFIWPMPFPAMDFAHCSSVTCSNGPGKTSPAAFATASNGPMPANSFLRLAGSEVSRLVVPGFSAHRDNAVPSLRQELLDRRSDRSSSKDDNSHAYLLNVYSLADTRRPPISNNLCFITVSFRVWLT